MNYRDKLLKQNDDIRWELYGLKVKFRHLERSLEKLKTEISKKDLSFLYLERKIIHLQFKELKKKRKKIKDQLSTMPKNNQMSSILLKKL